MKVGKGKISKKKSGNKDYFSYWIYVPSKLSKDPDFPFKDKEEVDIELIGSSLTVRKKYNLREITEAYGIEDATIAKIVEDKALLNKHKPFLYFKDKIYTYQEVNEISNQIANGLTKLTNELMLESPKIAVLFPNCPETLFCWFGVAKTRCIFVPVSFLLRHEILKFVLENSDTEILIIDHKYYLNFEAICDKLPNIKKIIIRNAPKGYNFDDKYIKYAQILSKDKENPKIEIKSNDPLEILYTSGTTGKPKGVLFRNYYTLSGISAGGELEGLGFKNNENKYYCPLPLFQGLPRYFMVIPIMYYNGSFIITEKFNINTFWEDIDKYKPDGFCYYGAYLSALVNQPPTEEDRKHSIKYAFGGGALKNIWGTFERRFGVKIVEVYSTVEGTGLTINVIGSKGGKLGSIGKSARGFELKIINTEGNELLPDRDNIGEICTRMKLPFQFEYYNLDKKIPERIDEDRWFHTGDFGYKDHDGYVYFLGRKSDIIIRDGESFFAVDIERVANSHTRISESAVFEVKTDNPLKNELKICAVIKKGTTLTYEEFHEFLKQNLAYFMVPRYVEFKEDFPKNANELIQKFILNKEWNDSNYPKNTYDAKLNKILK